MIPGLKSLDHLLLVHAPNLWCLRAHYVLPGSILAFVAMGLLGSFLGNSIIDSHDFYIVSFIAIIICGAVCLYWCYLQARQRYSFFQRQWAGFRNFLGYPFLMMSILLPAYAFDKFSGIESNTMTGDSEIFLLVALLASIAMVGTWMVRSLTVKSIVIGAVSAVVLSTIFIMLLVIIDNSALFIDNSKLFVVYGLLSVYTTFTLVALIALKLGKQTWATAASILVAPFVGILLAVILSGPDFGDFGYMAGLFSIAGGVIICTIFQPLLNRYRTFPQ